MTPRIVIVEDLAHKAAGHYPVMFAELAAALSEVGCRVTALTAQGWALESRGVFPDLDVRQLGRSATALRRAAAHLSKVPPQRYTQRASAVLSDAVMVREAGALRRRLDADAVIVMCKLIDPFVAAAVAADSRWLLCCFAPPRSSSRSWRASLRGWQPRGGPPGRLLVQTAQRAVSRRRSRGGATRVALNNETDRDLSTQSFPWLEPVHVPFMAPRPRSASPDARRRLDIPDQAKVALLFGAAHDLKDYDVVWSAFAELPDWQLIAAGRGCAESHADWSRRNGPPATEPTVLDGFVDDETRDLLHAATDLVVLSFHEGTQVESGTLFDAIAWGKPIVCSARTTPGEMVDRLDLGHLFEPGDAASLGAAVRAAPQTLPAGTVAAAQCEFSAASMARQFLDALGVSPAPVA